MEAARKRRARRKLSAPETDPNEDGKMPSAAGQNAPPLLECRGSNTEVRVWPFDFSIENHFRAVELVAELCGEADVGALDDGEIARLSSSIAFFRAVDLIVEPRGEADFGPVDDGDIASNARAEWRNLNYEAGLIKFAKGTRSLQEQDGGIEVNLPPFSSASVPQDNGSHTGRNSKDFVIYVGGSVWALDWCPRVCHRPEYQTKNEFIAVTAHPPGSSQHKLGAPLTGRGVIQIWSLLNISGEEEEASLVEKPRQRRSNSQLKEKSSQPPKPRGRPRKKPLERPSDDLNCNSQFGQPLAGDFVERTPVSYTLDGVSGVLSPQVTGKDSGPKQLSSEAAAFANTSRRLNNVGVESCHVDEHVSIMTENEGRFLPCISQQDHSGFKERSAANNAVESYSRSVSGTLISEDVAAPRLVFCLAHNGRVAWDVKWRPFDMHETKCPHLMGYLAVLLGNGSLEVWEVPLPRIVKVIYSSTERGDTDPRFVKLEPVFRCSTLKSGGVQSIPLSVEWSTSHPHEYLLVGCHDGTVALWKFFASNSSKDTRPLLHFTADTVPVRAVAWAPFASDLESGNVIVTAGHGGIKFWDMRDPFHPLWHIHSAPKNILSLDWLPDPRCVLLSFDDGTVRLLSLSRSAYDGPVTGKLLCGTKQGLHTLYCSSFAIWSVHVSRHTGIVAYSGADGNVCQFQLTSKAVDKDPSRHRAPHFLCSSVAEEGSAIVINMSTSDTPVTLGKPLKGTPSSTREMLSASLEVEEAMENEKGPAPDEQTLAICYGDDSTVEPGWEETLASFKSKTNQASGKPNKKKPRVEMQRVNEAEAVPGGADRTVTLREFETFPPKIVAMHRVRWNMNKGSERWLCSGGAAGILRCQEIATSSGDRKSKWK